MEKIRPQFQGVWNIIRFNWHFYVLAVVLVAALLVLSTTSLAPVSTAMLLLAFLIFTGTLTSLAVSHYIYDRSGLYELQWLDGLKNRHIKKIINVHAGFDETSELLKDKFAYAALSVFDFYDRAKHTEISIQRARKVYPPYPGTRVVNTRHLPVEDNSTDMVFNILSAHEIRNAEERIAFFREMTRILNPNGKIVVTEHLLDLPNLLVYNIGAFHFHTRATWKATFRNARLNIACEIKTTPFITTFILEKNGAPS